MTLKLGHFRWKKINLIIIYHLSVSYIKWFQQNKIGFFKFQVLSVRPILEWVRERRHEGEEAEDAEEEEERGIMVQALNNLTIETTVT